MSSGSSTASSGSGSSGSDNRSSIGTDDGFLIPPTPGFHSKNPYLKGVFYDFLC